MLGFPVLMHNVNFGKGPTLIPRILFGLCVLALICQRYVGKKRNKKRTSSPL
jgi:hypothetical protein